MRRRKQNDDLDQSARICCSLAFCLPVDCRTRFGTSSCIGRATMHVLTAYPVGCPVTCRKLLRSRLHEDAAVKRQLQRGLQHGRVSSGGAVRRLVLLGRNALALVAMPRQGLLPSGRHPYVSAQVMMTERTGADQSAATGVA